LLFHPMASSSKDECVICCDGFNKTVRQPIRCPFCSDMCCYKCYRTYFSESPDAHCMFCKKVWTRSTLMDLFPASYIAGDLRTHQANIILQQQKCLLPDTQPLVQMELARRMVDSDLQTVQKQRDQLMTQLRELSHREFRLKRQLEVNIYEQHCMQGEEAATSKKPRYLRACAFEGCKGFVDEEWVCGTCKRTTCKRCLASVSEGHICLEENVASAAVILQISRPCPSCGVAINKMEGCDMMWCTYCNTPFGWKDGKIITTGNIHNPHYFQYIEQLQARKGQAGLVEEGRRQRPNCEGMLPQYHSLFATLTRYDASESMKLVVRNSYNITSELLDYKINRLRYKARVNEERMARKRTLLLMNEITEEQFKAALIKDQISREKAGEFRDLYTAYADAARDLLVRIARSKDHASIYSTCAEIEALSEFMSEAAARISRTYNNCKIPYDLRYASHV
jgi:hypothetical protein